MAEQENPAAAAGGKKEKEQNPTIEELAAKFATPAWAFAGVKAAERWGAGKRSTEKEYKAAVERFRKGPMHRAKGADA